jgi:predicted ATPase/DNA-binding SARP family transcriptional activator
LSEQYDFRLLGPVELRVESSRLELGSKKQKALLAALLLRRNTVLSRSDIIDALWGEAPPRTATNVVQTYVSASRKAAGPDGGRPLESRLETVGAGYRLRVSEDELDLARAERKMGQAREAAQTGAWERAAVAAAEACAEWRGQPLADLDDEPVVSGARSRLARLRVAAMCLWAEAELECGRVNSIAEPLEHLTAEAPFDEEVSRLRMVALYRAGRQAEALHEYERIRHLLADELGVDPGDRLRLLHAQILNQDPAVAAETPREVPWFGPRPPAESPIGREAELADLESAVSNGRRLVSLVGAAGCGKTRLAYALAHRAWVRAQRQSADFRDGVAVIELASLSNPNLLASTVASTLNLREQRPDDATSNLVDRLRSARLLLVLDNCEHVLGACADLLEKLIRGCPGVGAITTSREALGLPEEHVRAVPPLAVPPSESATALDAAMAYPAVQLLIERARNAGAPPMRPEDARAVVDITRRLDGIPLAIELAAARLGVLTPPEVADRLDDRFRLLANGRRTSFARHQTLRAALDWSYQLLDDDDQKALGQLSVFPAAFTLEAAGAVLEAPADDALQRISSLVAKSLLAVERTGRTSRYLMLETIREYAQGRSADTRGTALSRFFDYYSRRVREACGHHLDSQWQNEVEWLRAEHANLRFALEWGLERADPLPAQYMAAQLRPYFVSSGRAREGLAFLEEALEVGTAIPLGLAGELLVGAAFLQYHHRGALTTCRRLLEQSLLPLELAGSRDLLLFARAGLAGMAVQRLEPALADLPDEMLRSHEDNPYLTGALLVKGSTNRVTGQWRRANSYYAEALSHCNRDGGRSDLAPCHTLLARNELDWGGDLAAAGRHLQVSLDVALELGDDSEAAAARTVRARLDMERGQLGAAEQDLDLAATWAEANESDRRLCGTRREQAELRLRQGNLQGAAVACAESLQLAVIWDDMESAREALGIAAQILSAFGCQAASANIASDLFRFHAHRGWPLPRRLRRMLSELPAGPSESPAGPAAEGDPPCLRDLAAQTAKVLLTVAEGP